MGEGPRSQWKGWRLAAGALSQMRPEATSMPLEGSLCGRTQPGTEGKQSRRKRTPLPRTGKDVSNGGGYPGSRGLFPAPNQQSKGITGPCFGAQRRQDKDTRLWRHNGRRCERDLGWEQRAWHQKEGRVPISEDSEGRIGHGNGRSAQFTTSRQAIAPQFL